MSAIHDDVHTELLSENEALRSAIRRSESDFEEAAALVEQHLEEIKRLRAELVRMEAKVLMLEWVQRESNPRPSA